MKTTAKPTLTLFFLTIFFTPLVSISQIAKFAVIGDYGKAGPAEHAVSNLVKSWNPDFIITLGDNNYECGAQSTIDSNIGQYYHEFIYPDSGFFGTGDTVNRFFPSMGNHDWDTPDAIPYLNYFTLPGNERYYDFVKVNIHFFVISSDPREPDGIDSNSIQAQWLKNQLAQSSEKWNIIYFHHPPYSSSSVHGSTPIMQWPFKRWGATTVLSGHDHLYERIHKNNFTYFVNGLGGYPLIYEFDTSDIVEGSQLRYNKNYGAMLIDSYDDSLMFKFYSIGDTLFDNFKILPAIKTFSLTVSIQGFYNPNENTSISDTVNVYLRNNNPPYSIVDSAKNYLESSGTCDLSFSNTFNATEYYIVVKHRNSIETWSESAEQFSANVLNYDFTPSLSRAYGNNMIRADTTPVRFAIYSGDVNQDGSIDLIDMLHVHNDAVSFANGYLVTDVNGDMAIDLSDIVIIFNNSINFVKKKTP